MDVITELYVSVYADMLEYRMQMYEEVPYAHLHYKKCYNSLMEMTLEERRIAICSS